MTAGLLAAGLVAASLAVLGGAARRGDNARARRDLAPATVPARRRSRHAPHWFVDRLVAADVGLPPHRLWRAWVSACVAVPIGLWRLAGLGLAVVTAVVVVAGPALACRANRGRAAARLQAALPAALEEVARSLRSGAGLRAAVREAGAATPGALGADLGHVARTAEAIGIVPALEAWGATRSLPGVRLAVAALCLGAETGGAQARAIDGVAATLRQRLSAAAEARALASQARASAAVIALSPILFCGLTSATDSRVAAFLFRSGAGAAVLTAGLLLDTAGALWMARLTRTVT